MKGHVTLGSIWSGGVDAVTFECKMELEQIAFQTLRGKSRLDSWCYAGLINATISLLDAIERVLKSLSAV